MSEIIRKSLPDVPFPYLRTVAYDRTPQSWNNIKHTAGALYIGAFEHNEEVTARLKKIFCDDPNPISLLYDMSLRGDGELIGFTFITPMSHRDIRHRRNISTAHITTVLTLEYEGNETLTNRLINHLEPTLQSYGYEQMERSADVRTGQAKNLKDYYGDRLVESSIRPGLKGEPRENLLIKL